MCQLLVATGWPGRQSGATNLGGAGAQWAPKGQEPRKDAGVIAEAYTINQRAPRYDNKKPSAP